MNRPNDNNSERIERLGKLIADVQRRRADGENITDKAIIAEHPDLMPELAQELRKLQMIEAARDEADQDSEQPGSSSDAPTIDHVESTKGVAKPDTIRYFGDYEILDEINKGGMGVVYKAKQVSLNRIVALKMIRSGELADEEQVKRFYVEAEAAANLDHANIVPLYEVGQHQGQHYFSMAFIDGPSLGDLLRDNVFAPRQASEYVETAAEAIHYAHGQGVLHRDIKPGNLLIDGAGELRITDFGLAKRIGGDSDLTRDQQTLGTPSYMPPEQAQGKSKEIDARTDVYALGATLYALLTGRPPFRADDPVATLKQVIENEPVSPRDLNPAIDRDLETITLKCLEKEPSRRYASAQALADDLRQFLDGEPVAARPIGRIERSWRYARRHPAQAGLIAASFAVLLAVVGVAVSVVYQSRLEQANSRLQAANQRLSKSERNLAGANDGLKQSLARETQAAVELQRSNQRLHATQAALERLVNSRRIMQALQEWEVGEIARATALLDECPPALRDWEWYYVNRLCRGELQTIAGHAKGISCMRLSTDGSWFVCGDSSGALRIWDANSGEELAALGGHEHAVTCVALSRDSKLIASGGLDKTIMIWDAKTRQRRRVIGDFPSPVYHAQFSPDGEWLITGSGDRQLIQDFQMWSVATGKEMELKLAGDVKPAGPFIFSPDGVWFAAVSSHGGVQLWDAKSGEAGVSAKFKDRDSYIWDIAFRADGKWIAASCQDKTIKLWETATGNQLVDLVGHEGDVRRIAFSLDGKRLVGGGGDATIKVWNVEGIDAELTKPNLAMFFSRPERLSPEFTLKGHQSTVNNVAVTPDNQRIVSVSEDAEIKIWKARATVQILGDGLNDGPVLCAAISPDGRLIAGGRLSNNQVDLWDVASGGRTTVLTSSADTVSSRILCAAFSPSGAVVAAGSSGGRRRNVAGVLVQPDGSRISSKSTAGNVTLWNAKTSVELTSFQGHTDAVTCVAFRPDGKQVVSGGWDRTIRIWDSATGKEINSIGPLGGQVWSMAMAPDGRRVVVTGGGNAIEVWDIDSGSLVRSIPTATLGKQCCAFSHSGKWIAGPASRSEVKIWEADTGRHLLTLRGHSAEVTGIAFSPDDRRIATSSNDKKVKVWDTTGGDEVLTLRGHDSFVHGVAFSRDGKSIASAGSDGTIRVWATDRETAAATSDASRGSPDAAGASH